ncbi:MAG: glycosyltransferase family protein, partial [Chitinophagaceae bacterium]
LQKMNMEVCCVIVGSSSRREIPDFFKQKFDVPIVSLESPHFVTGTDNKSIRLGKTAWKNMLKIAAYHRSISIIHKLIIFHKADLIINFYEPLIGMYRLFHKPSCKILSIAHQYVYLHQSFQFPAGNWFQRQALIQYSKLTSIKSDMILAISQYNLPRSKSKNLIVIPPLLRSELFRLQAQDKNFILVYILNRGYMNDILQWHKKNPSSKLHCFTDCREVKEVYAGEWKVDETLSFHSLNDKKFLDMMAACSGMATTAGFESVCEAMYLCKPLLVVPVMGHFEQYCNAQDTEIIGAGLYSSHFNLEKLVRYIPFYGKNNGSYRQWVNDADDKLIGSILSLFTLR